MVGHLVCKTKDKNKIKTYEQRYRIRLYRQRQITISLWYGEIAMGYHSLWLENGYDRFTSRRKLKTEFQFHNLLHPGPKKEKKNETETKIWIEKDGLDWEIV